MKPAGQKPAGFMHLCCGLLEYFWDLAMRGKLQSRLNHLERRAVTEGGCHLKFHSGFDRELELIPLMDVVKPGINNIAVLHFQKVIHQVTTVSASFIGEREGGKHIVIVILPQHFSQYACLLVAYLSQAMIVGYVRCSVFFVEQSSCDVGAS